MHRMNCHMQLVLITGLFDVDSCNVLYSIYCNPSPRIDSITITITGVVVTNNADLFKRRRGNRDGQQKGGRGGKGRTGPKKPRGEKKEAAAADTGALGTAAPADAAPAPVAAASN